MDKFDHIFIAPTDFDKSFEFYKENLGWKVVCSWGENDEPRGAVIKSEGAMMVVIAEEHDNKGDNAWEENKGFINSRPSIHLNCEDVNQKFAQMKDKSSVVIPPEDNHWGTRWMVIKDPDDNLVAFNTAKE